jgi:AraC-like DNA-binding protein
VSLTRQAAVGSGGGGPGAVPRHPLAGPTFEELPDRARIDWHDHDVHQLVHPGRGVLTISTRSGAWVVPPQRAVWIPAGVAHAHLAHGPTQLRTLCFPASAALPAACLVPGAAPGPAVLAVSPLLREVIVALTDGGGSYGPRQRADLERVALDQLRRVDALPVHLPAPEDDRLRAAAALLHGDPADDRTLGQLGAVVGASERTLSRLFRGETGMSFPQWRAQLRLHHSLVLLAAGTPVTATATACGYANPSAFIQAFRLAFGQTPGRYGASA